MPGFPTAIAGGVWLQYLFGYNFSVAVWVGFISIFGMVDEDSVLITTYINDLFGERNTVDYVLERHVTGMVDFYQSNGDNDNRRYVVSLENTMKTLPPRTPERNGAKTALQAAKRLTGDFETMIH